MKSFFLSILAFLYISTSAGVTFHMHYCMGKLADSGLTKNTSKTCSTCGMEETGNGCCRHEAKFVKNDTDQKTTDPGFQFIQLIYKVPHHFFEEALSNNFSAGSVVIPINHPPPADGRKPVYIRNCVFLI